MFPVHHCTILQEIGSDYKNSHVPIEGAQSNEVVCAPVYVALDEAGTAEDNIEMSVIVSVVCCCDSVTRGAGDLGLPSSSSS